MRRDPKPSRGSHPTPPCAGLTNSRARIHGALEKTPSGITAVNLVAKLVRSFPKGFELASLPEC
jgi:hypothetical protein